MKRVPVLRTQPAGTPGVDARSRLPAGGQDLRSTIVAEFFPSGEWVRMVATLHPMHDEEFTKMSAEGLSSQLTKLDKRFDRKR